MVRVFNNDNNILNCITNISNDTIADCFDRLTSCVTISQIQVNPGVINTMPTDTKTGYMPRT